MTQLNKSNQPLRFAMYLRYSSEMQNEISLEEQEAVCRRWVAANGGRIVAIYRDGAETGWTLDRPGLTQMNKEASKHRFDALILWKFDRLARDPSHAVIIKAFLRHEHGLELFAVEGGSADDDGTVASWLNEQIYAVFSALYSMNLSVDTKRSKHHRAIEGRFNGSKPPFGYDLVTKQQSTYDRPPGLYINPREAALVRRVFRLYASGEHSDLSIATWLNERQYVQRAREGQKPFGKETIRDMLQNRHRPCVNPKSRSISVTVFPLVSSRRIASFLNSSVYCFWACIAFLLFDSLFVLWRHLCTPFYLGQSRYGDI